MGVGAPRREAGRPQSPLSVREPPAHRVGHGPLGRPPGSAPDSLENKNKNKGMSFPYWQGKFFPLLSLRGVAIGCTVPLPIRDIYNQIYIVDHMWGLGGVASRQ